jgi:hypothetical protein
VIVKSDSSTHHDDREHPGCAENPRTGKITALSVLAALRRLDRAAGGRADRRPAARDQWARASATSQSTNACTRLGAGRCRADDAVGVRTGDALAEGRNQPARVQEAGHEPADAHGDALPAQRRLDHLLVGVEADGGGGLEVGEVVRGEPRAPVEEATGPLHVQQGVVLEIIERAQGQRALALQTWAADRKQILAEQSNGTLRELLLLAEAHRHVDEIARG